MKTITGFFGGGKKPSPHDAPAVAMTTVVRRISSAPTTVDLAQVPATAESNVRSLGNEPFAFNNLGGIRFSPVEIETQSGLAHIIFKQIINDAIHLGQHLFSRVAIAQINGSSKTCLIFADKNKVTADDLQAVGELLKDKGYHFPDDGVQGYFAMSSLVMALSQGHLDAESLAVDRSIARDSSKNSLMSSFVDIVAWAYANNADDIDLAVDVTSAKSQICFKIGGRYIRPERYLLPTDTVLQMLGIAWQKSGGGAQASFEVKTEQQANINLELPKSVAIPKGARVRLRWSGMANDKGTTVTTRIQRLGDSAMIRSLDDAGYLTSHMDILKRVIHSEGGMVVLSGVVGSGKSTSLTSLMTMLPRDIKIVSFEDPVELDIPGAHQKTITRDLLATGPDPAFTSATRALYRSAMDVLYLGEIRDRETGLVARQVTESGHSVYTTTHARSALGIFDRFSSPAIDIPRDVLATPEIVKLLVYQALLPVTCPECGKAPDDHVHAFNLTGDALTKHHEYFDLLYRLYGIEPSRYRMRDPRGCDSCRKEELPELNGLKGRTVVAEMIEPDEQMLEHVLTGNNIELTRYWRSLASSRFDDSNLVGKNTMECAIYKAAHGLIDPREIEPRFMSFETVEAKRNSARHVTARTAHAPVELIKKAA